MSPPHWHPSHGTISVSHNDIYPTYLPSAHYDNSGIAMLEHHTSPNLDGLSLTCGAPDIVNALARKSRHHAVREPRAHLNRVFRTSIPATCQRVPYASWCAAAAIRIFQSPLELEYGHRPLSDNSDIQSGACGVWCVL